MGTRKERPLQEEINIPESTKSRERGEERNREDSRELAVEAGDDLADSLRGTGGGGDDVVANRTSSAPVLVRWTVDGLLRRGRRVHGRHETLDNAKFVVDNLGERCKAVGCAGGVGNLRSWCRDKTDVKGGTETGNRYIQQCTWSRRRRG